MRKELKRKEKIVGQRQIPESFHVLKELTEEMRGGNKGLWKVGNHRKGLILLDSLSQHSLNLYFLNRTNSVAIS